MKLYHTTYRPFGLWLALLIALSGIPLKSINAQALGEECLPLTNSNFAWEGQLIFVTDTTLVRLTQNDSTVYTLDVPAEYPFLIGESASLSPDHRWVSLTFISPENETYLLVYDLETGEINDWYLEDRETGGWYDSDHVIISPEPPAIFGSELLNIQTGDRRLLVDWTQSSLPAPESSISTDTNWAYKGWREQYSPNGRYIFYLSDNLKLTVADLTTEEVLWTRQSFRSAFEHYGAWHPDGDVVVYVYTEPAAGYADDITDSNLFAVEIPSGQHRQLFGGDVFGESLSWSPSGNRLAFTSFIFNEQEYSSCLNILQSNVHGALSQLTRFTLPMTNMAGDMTWISEDVVVFSNQDELWFVDLHRQEVMIVPIDVEQFRFVGWTP